MNHASLFTGLGGFDLAAKWMGWKNVFQVEKDPFCRKVLRQHFSDTELYETVEGFNGTKYRGAVDVLTGGFPCQDISIANPNGEGLGGARSGLWYEMLRIIGEVEPAFVVGENVTNLKRMGYERIQADLESIGYKVEFFDIPACAVALQTMERHLWIVATSHRQRLKRGLSKTIPRVKAFAREFPGSNPGDGERWALPAARVCGMAERIPNHLDRIKALGNAIVPQVAFEIFKAIEQAS